VGCGYVNTSSKAGDTLISLSGSIEGMSGIFIPSVFGGLLEDASSVIESDHF